MKAMLFPGQGSQSIGMLADLAAQFPIIEQTFVTASEVLGYDLWQIVQTGPETTLNITKHTQPALLAASVAIYRIWQMQQGPAIAYFAGHSLGEYSALVCADALEFTDAIALVAKRGELMQQAVPEGHGAMAAIIGLSDDDIGAICSAIQTPTAWVSCANYNCPGQVVIAGHRAAVEQAMALATEQHAKLVSLLPVSVPSHCCLMQPAATALAEHIAQITWQMPSIPVISNVTAKPHHNVAAIREALTAQLSAPVLWQASMTYLRDHGVTQCYECGPSRVLTGLNKRIDRSLVTMPLQSPEDVTNALHRESAS